MARFGAYFSPCGSLRARVPRAGRGRVKAVPGFAWPRSGGRGCWEGEDGPAPEPSEPFSRRGRLVAGSWASMGRRLACVASVGWELPPARGALRAGRAGHGAPAGGFARLRGERRLGQVLSPSGDSRPRLPAAPRRRLLQAACVEAPRANMQPAAVF